MKNFIKTWSYRFEATFYPCLAVYAVMVIINTYCILKEDTFTSMGEWFSKHHLDFLFFIAFLIIVLIHAMYLQRYYYRRPALRRLMILPQSRRILFFSETLTIFLSLLAVAVLQGLLWTLALVHFYGISEASTMLDSVYETGLMQRLIVLSFDALFMYISFLGIACFIQLMISDVGSLKSFTAKLFLILIASGCFIYFYFIDDRFYIFTSSIWAFVCIADAYCLYVQNGAGV